MPVSPATKEMLPQDAKFLANFIAMGPFVFQAALCLRDFGVLATLGDYPDGISFDALLKETPKLNRYGLSVLLDAGESSGLLEKDKDLYTLTKIGHFLDKDAITRVNMNFSQDVCYKGLFNLKESIETSSPAGLKVFGNWNTIYEGLSSLPEQVKKSWFDFDHFYSDESFPRALPIIFQGAPKKVLDVGGNTGKFALACTEFDPEVQVTIVDHGTQIEMANKNIAAKGMNHRVSFFPTNLLDHNVSLPEGHDVIWMSQFLDCFGEEDIVQILRRARNAMGANSSLFIMETFTDNQKFNTARFCLDMTSLYFTAMANGNSRMYRVTDFRELIKKAELKLVEEFNNIRGYHTILKIQK